MAFQKGKSGNPKGRPRGTGKVAALREQIAEHVPSIVKGLIDAALAGDMQAARLLLDRALPPLRAEDGAVTINMPAGGSLSDQGDAIVKAAADGRITPAQANAMTTALSSLARIREVTELESRIEALEAANAQSQ
ncbi:MULTISPECIES: DUF5681 domain-containing protein [Ralstonia]|uniref:DUF5681 domain-containing protein n=1 Tax=Ralstonia pickettii TaxID=329 RepID=UPI000818C6C8|nr:DUF5681 domain-containing protein [Ralstonia pickettii]OCS50803.1 hypothetical protein BEK68_09700 [Ralstonia pickettii]